MNQAELGDIGRSMAQSGLALLIQSSVVLLLGLGLGRILRRRGPLAQSVAYRATLAAVVCTGLFSAVLASHLHPMWRISLPAAPQGMVIMSSSTASADGGAWNEKIPVPLPTPPNAPPVPAPAVKPATIPVVPNATEPSLPWTSWLYVGGVGIWGAGMLLLLAWFGLGQWTLFRLRRGSKPVASGEAWKILTELNSKSSTQCPLSLRVSSHVRSPFLAGVRQPTIYLPDTYAQDFDAAELRAILAHEAAHCERRDVAWTLAVRLTSTLLWPQPLIWLLSRRMEQAAEEACDILVLTHGCQSRAYADCLLSLAERLTPSRTERSLGLGVVPFRSQVGRRIEQILSGVRHPRTISRSLRLGVVFGAFCVVMFSLSLVAIKATPSTENGTAVTIVQNYLNARTAGKYAAAYMLLTPASWQSLSPQPDWSKGRDLSHAPISQQQSPSFLAAMAFFVDTHNSLGASYHVLGTKSGDPHTVRVAAQLPGKHGDIVLNIAVVPLSTNPFWQRIDLLKSAEQIDPTLYRFYLAKTAHSKQEICESHLKQIGMGLLEYAADHHEHFPDADHWVDEIMPYLKDITLFHDPNTPASQKYGYAFNRNLSGLSLSRLNAPQSTVAVFESIKSTRNASDTGQSLLYSKSFTEGSEFLFADGHVKRLRADQSLFFIIDKHPTPEVPQLPVVALPPATVPKAQAVTLVGRVVFPNGKPAPGVMVFAQLSDMPHDTAQYRNAVEEARGATDTNGRYVLTGLSYDHYNVMADEATGQWVAVAARDVIGKKGATVTVPDRVLTRGAWLVGKVMDAKTGQPLKGISIGSYGPARPDTSAAILYSQSTGSDGRYKLCVAAGRNEVYVTQPQASTGNYAEPGQSIRYVTVKEGETKVLPFRLAKGSKPQAVVPTPSASSRADLLAGLTPVQGPGVIVMLSDSKRPLPGKASAAIMPNLIHDTDINTVVNELKSLSQ